MVTRLGAHDKAKKTDTVKPSSAAKLNARRTIRYIGRGKPDFKKLPETVFLHIGKTGGTTLKRLIIKIQKRDKVEKKAVYLTHGAALENVFAVHPDLKIACIIRDPISRFVSGFNSRLRAGRPSHDRRWTPAEASAFSYFPTAESLAIAFSSDDARLQSAAMFAMNAIAHLRRDYAHHFSSAEYVRSNADRFSLVVPIDQLNEQLPTLLTALGVRYQEEDLDFKREHVAPKELRSDLSEEARKNLRSVLSQDYEIYNELMSISQNKSSFGPEKAHA